MAWKFDREGFARAVAGKRDVLGLGLRDLAAQVGMSTATICRIESKGYGEVDHVVALCEWLGLRVDSFISTEGK